VGIKEELGMLNQEPTKRCPYCAEIILLAAIKCKHCGEMLNTVPVRTVNAEIRPPLQQRSFLRQPLSKISFEKVILYSTWLFVGLFSLLGGIFGTLMSLVEASTPREGSSDGWLLYVTFFAMTFVGLGMCITADRIVNLKRGTTVIAGISTLISILVFVSPLINQFINPNDNSYPMEGVGIFTVLYGICLMYATRRLRTLAY
jgi:hypothetical protein